DGDGIQDGTELGITVGVPDPDGPGPLLGTDPLAFVPDADPLTTTNPLKADTDNGGTPDGVEDFNKNGKVDAGECNPNLGADDGNCADTDGDGLSDAQETTLGTNPNDADTDDDGLSDGNEVNVRLTDPLKRDSD